MHQVPTPKGPPRVNPETLINSESMRRQPSCDGEAIKIVIDDVDSDATFGKPLSNLFNSSVFVL